MQKILFFLLFFNITSLHAMILTIDKLPQDIRLYLIDFIATDLFSNKPREAARTIKAFSHTNKQLNIDINTPETSNHLIKIIAQKYCCSHESISNFLHTKQTKQRSMLQRELKNLCCSTKDNNLSEKLDDLISKGVNLEYIYNHNYQQKTALMIASNYNNNMFKYLLERKANINGCTSYGMTMLHLATHRPKRCFIKFIENSGIAFNQQDKRHQTALLYCIIRRKDPADAHFIAMIIKLLENGTDPELTNKDGFTPLTAATEKLKDGDEKDTVIQLINDAIERKHATTALSSSYHLS